MTYQINFRILLPAIWGAVILFIMFVRWNPISPSRNPTTVSSNSGSMVYESSSHTQENIESIRNLYLKTMIVTLTGYAFKDDAIVPSFKDDDKVDIGAFNDEKRRQGGDWPSIGFTMVGTEALENIRELLHNVFTQEIEGDFLEAGVWRGGASIFAKAMVQVYGQTSRHNWVCDSFQGLPKATQGKDSDTWSKLDALSISKEIVSRNFEEFFLLDNQVHFVEGYFVYSLPCLRNEFINNGRKLAVLRADGDMYESSMDILYNLYEFVSIGGFVIIDDYGIPACKKAVDEFRKKFDIFEPIVEMTKSWTTRRGQKMRMYWRVERKRTIDYKWYKDFLKTRDLDDSKTTCS